ncbi:MAG TPA: TonB-dependent receptor [Devosiaceae bacterium]|jgi:hemoglobin/transferrin/lactoferrin receptor protein
MGLVGKNTAVLLSSVAIAVLTSASGALAQEQNANYVTLLERLVIGAGEPKIAIDTPQAVTVLDQEDIDGKQPTTIRDALEGIPSTTVIGSDRVFGEAFNIRGIGATDSSSDGSRIIVTVDGAPKFNEQYRMGSFFSDPELYKRVEVLRGPASATLYGSGALGGAINFTTKDGADFIKDGYSGAVRLKGEYDSNGDGTLGSVLLAQRINETFDILATGNWRRSDDFDLADGSTLSGSAFDSLSGLIKGTARFGDNNEQVLRLSYQRWQSDADNQDYAQTGTMAPFVGFGTVDRKVTDDTVVLSYENPDAANPWLDVNLNVSYSSTQNQQRNATGAGSPLFDDVDYAYNTFQLKGDNTIDYEAEGFANHFTFGGLISQQHREASKPNGEAPSPFHPQGVENKLGVFVQDEAVWNDRLALIGGLRADFHDMQPSDLALDDVKGVAWSPKLAALYAINDNINIFSSVAHTERFPTLDELFSTQAAGPTTHSRVASLDLRPEMSNNFEAGFTVSGYDVGGLENAVSVKTTAFYNDLTDMITTTPSTVADGAPYYYNVNKAHIYGVEVEGAYDSDVFFGRLAYTLIKGEDGTTGDDLANIPAAKLVATLGLRNVDWGLEYGVRATIAADPAKAVADANFDPTTSKAYQSYDVFANWKSTGGPLEGTEARFSIENIFDADFRDNLSVDRSKGRTFKLTLAKQFDY